MNYDMKIDYQSLTDGLLKKYDYGIFCQREKKVLVIGIGGGSDIVGAFSIASVLHERNPDVEILYGLCVSPKNRYDGFEMINGSLYQRRDDIQNVSTDHLHHSPKLLIKMARFKNDLPNPFLIVRPKKNQDLIEKAFRDVIEELKPDLIYAIDLGGDSLTGGLDDDDMGFDRSGIRALQKIARPFIYMVLGPGCDGESECDKIIDALQSELSVDSLLGIFELTKEIEFMSGISQNLLDKNRTPSIITNAFLKIKENPDNREKLVEIERHIHPKIPLQWLISGVVLDGNKFNG